MAEKPRPLPVEETEMSAAEKNAKKELNLAKLQMKMAAAKLDYLRAQLQHTRLQSPDRTPCLEKTLQRSEGPQILGPAVLNLPPLRCKSGSGLRLTGSA